MHKSVIYWIRAAYRQNEPKLAQDKSPAAALNTVMKRLWIGKRLDGLLLRRDAEAALFEAGLSITAPVAVAPVSTPMTADQLNDAEAARLGV